MEYYTYKTDEIESLSFIKTVSLKANKIWNKVIKH